MTTADLAAEVERLRALVKKAVDAGLELENAYELSQRQYHNYEEWEAEQWDRIDAARQVLCACLDEAAQ